MKMFAVVCLLFFSIVLNSSAIELSLNKKIFIPGDNLVLTLNGDWLREIDIYVAITLPNDNTPWFLTEKQNFVETIVPYSQILSADSSNIILQMSIPEGLLEGKYTFYATTMSSFFDRNRKVTETSFIYTTESELSESDSLIEKNWDWNDLSFIKSSNNPIIYPDMNNLEDEIGSNINGPSVIQIPSWIKNPLGKYYMYFAHHEGKYIRLAFANNPEGPWTIYKNGVLNLTDTEAIDHIASPDVHVDTKNNEIRMYFHGLTNGNGQQTFIAVSKNGIDFSANPNFLGLPYFRVFRHKNYYFALAKKVNNGGMLLRSNDGFEQFKQGPILIDDMRHAAVHVDNDQLIIFYSRIGDAPEVILQSVVKLNNDWKSWKASKPTIVLRPEHYYEGIQLPIKPSKSGVSVLPVHEIRDPGLLITNEGRYLYYSIAGEMGIGVAKIF